MLLQFPGQPPFLHTKLVISLPATLTLGFPMPSIAGEFETGPMLRNSTTQYRWMTDDEFLSAIESRFGKSPILDELYSRMARNSDAIEWIEDAEDRLETSETEHKAKLESLEETLKKTIEKIEEMPKQAKVRCAVCDANLTFKF